MRTVAAHRQTKTVVAHRQTRTVVALMQLCNWGLALDKWGQLMHTGKRGQLLHFCNWGLAFDKWGQLLHTRNRGLAQANEDSCYTWQMRTVVAHAQPRTRTRHATNLRTRTRHMMTEQTGYISWIQRQCTYRDRNVHVGQRKFVYHRFHVLHEQKHHDIYCAILREMGSNVCLIWRSWYNRVST